MTPVLDLSSLDQLEAAAMAFSNLTLVGDRGSDGNSVRDGNTKWSKFQSLLMNLTLLHHHHSHHHHHHHHQHGDQGMLKGIGGNVVNGGRNRGGEITDEVWLDANRYGTNGSGINLTSTSTTLTFSENTFVGSEHGEEAGNQAVSLGLQDECDPLLDLLDFFHLYYIPFIILVGLVGNLLSCVVFLNTHLRLRSSSYYLAALATADLGFLATLFLVWLNNNAGVVVFNRDGWCQGLVYVSSVCSFLSVWLIVAFTVERFIAVQYPLHRPHMCTVARAKGIVLALTVFALISHSYSFVMAGMVRGFVVPSGGGGTAGGDVGVEAEMTRKNYSEGGIAYHPEIDMAEGESPLGGPSQSVAPGDEVCDMLEQYHEAMRVINIVDSVLTLIAPLTLIVLMNTMITRNLLRFGRRFRPNGGMTIVGSTLGMEHSGGGEGNAPETLAMGDVGVGGGGGSGSGSGGNSRASGGGGGGGPSRETSEANLNKVTIPNSRRRPSQHSCHSTKSNSRHMRNNTATEVSLRCNHVRSSTRNLVSTRTQQSITKMLLLISTVFVLLNLPSYVIRLYVFLCFSLWKQRAPTSLWCLQQFFMLLYYTNFSINFLLYSMCGATFRRCLWQLIRKKLKTLSRSHCNPQRYT
ncbi:trissin receptor [Hetaerina americana]|uniref:trissin receptor n=1 Tax=Hetaerina americana TaxID=62018 RepID=UPI003A7F2FF0